MSAVLLTVCASASAASHRGRRGLPVLHLEFRQHGYAAKLLSNGRYAFAAPSNTAAPGILFDDLRHRERAVAQDGCGAAGSVIFGGVLAFDCWRSSRAAPEVYSIASGSRRAVPLDPSITDPCGSASECSSATAVQSAGSTWLAVSVSICPGGEHCASRTVFQNRFTGAVKQDPAVGRGPRAR